MKKVLAYLTGIVFLMSVLAAVGCKQPLVQPPERDPEEVIIHLKAVKKDGEKHLKLFDPYNPGYAVVDTLETIVIPGDTVVWKLKRFSRIEKIDKIGPQTKGKIITKDAEPVPGTKYFRLIIPFMDTLPIQREKYIIEFEDKRGNPHKIDPYLKIRPR